MTGKAISPLRWRMIEDMTIRKLAPKTQASYIRAVRDFTVFLGRSPDQASAEDTCRPSVWPRPSAAGVREPLTEAGIPRRSAERPKPIKADLAAIYIIVILVEIAGSGRSKMFRTRTSDGAEQGGRLIKIDFGDQEIDERPHPRRQPAAMAHIDDIDLLDHPRCCSG